MLKDTVKMALRVSADALDDEVDMLIDAAKADLVRAGLRRSYVDEESSLVQHAIVLFCKAHFGYDNDEAPRFQEAYRMCVCDLLNSRHFALLEYLDSPEDEDEDLENEGGVFEGVSA